MAYAHTRILKLRQAKELPTQGAHFIRPARLARTILRLSLVLCLAAIGCVAAELFLPGKSLPLAATALALLLIGSMLGPVLAISLGKLHAMNTWLENYQKVRETLAVTSHVFMRMLLDEQKQLARARLSSLGMLLRKEEIAHQDNPLHESVEEARYRFRAAYDVLLEFGLIENVGYGQFIPKSA